MNQSYLLPDNPIHINFAEQTLRYALNNIQQKSNKQTEENQ